MLASRLLIALVGALRASALGSFAVGVAYGGIRMLASAEPYGLLLVTWALLGVAGVAGLWLGVITGPGSIVAAALIGCGLAAEAVLIWLAVTGAALATPFTFRSLDAAYATFLSLPLLVGAAYICHALVRACRKGGGQQAV